MDMESVCFEIITCLGSAKSNYVEAITLAQNGHLKEARQSIKEGDKYFAEGHHVHADLIAKEADGNPVPVSMLLVHAEDQMMSAETARIYANAFIDIYEQLKSEV